MNENMAIGILFVMVSWAILLLITLHLRTKLREARFKEKIAIDWFELEKKRYLGLHDTYCKLKTDHSKLQMQFKGLGVSVHDVTCLKDDCPDYEDDKCTGTFEYCNGCMVRVIRKNAFKDNKVRGELR